MIDDDEFENRWTRINLFDMELNITSVCDECCRPLWIYGFNPRLIPNENDQFIYNEFCDDHAEEFGVEKINYSKKSKDTILAKFEEYENQDQLDEKISLIRRILKSFAAGMNESDILKKYNITHNDILVFYAFVANRI